MASQIGYVYSANRLAERPFSSILHTFDRLDYGNKCSRRKDKSGGDVIGQELESIG
jgi:hypothetical protein